MNIDGLVVNLLRGDALKDVDYLGYGRWNEDKNGKYIVPSLLSGSDYSGSLVERSNYKVFQETFAEGEGEWWANVVGGHGTFGIIISIEDAPDEANEFFKNIEDYPLADEDAHSELEMEAQDKAWENWTRRDFTREIEKKFDVDLDDVDHEKIFELFRRACDKSNTYWENEQGDSMYIDLERVVKSVGKKDVEEIMS